MTDTTVEAPEIWTLDGNSYELVVRDVAAELAAYYAANPDEEDYGDDGWYPDFPGDRPPVCYKMVPVNGGDEHFYNVTGAYYSAYDDVANQLYRDGWEGPPPTEEELATCEHGLSLRLCAGPMHYPDDRNDW